MNLLKSTGTFGFYTIISRLLGYLRDILIAVFLGTGLLADAFFVAFRIPNTFRRLFSEGTFNSAFVPSYASEMIKNKKGNILSIVTTYAWTGSPFVVPSAAAKAGVLAMTRSLAVEWGKHNIRFNAIAPGPFPTEGAWSRLMPPGFDDFEDGMKNKIPMKRFGERHELENLASYLMSDGSAYVNGEVITIDGGEWLAGAGEFSDLTKLPDSMWKAMADRRKKK